MLQHKNICARAQASKLTHVSVVARVSLLAGGPPELINAAMAAVKGTDGRGGLPGGVEAFIIAIPSRFADRHEWPESLQAGNFACSPTVLGLPPWVSLLADLRDAATAQVNLERAARSPASHDMWEGCMRSLRKFLGFTQVMGWRRVGLALLWDGYLLMEYASFLLDGRDVEGGTAARELAALHRLAGLSVGYLPEAERAAAPSFLVRPVCVGD